LHGRPGGAVPCRSWTTAAVSSLRPPASTRSSASAARPPAASPPRPGVNEVTLFRTFGSKEALIEEALRHHARTGSPSIALLPEHPVDPERELTAWAAAQLAELREHRSLIRKSMGEIEERPELAPTVTAGWATCDAVLHEYLGRLRVHGFIDAAADDDLLAGGAMLMGALFSDAMGRDMLPALFPQPEQDAPAVYVRLFLRAVACRGPSCRRARRPDRDGRTSLTVDLPMTPSARAAAGFARLSGAAARAAALLVLAAAAVAPAAGSAQQPAAGGVRPSAPTRRSPSRSTTPSS
jgi:hypothetical protein